MRELSNLTGALVDALMALSRVARMTLFPAVSHALVMTGYFVSQRVMSVPCPI